MDYKLAKFFVSAIQSYVKEEQAKYLIAIYEAEQNKQNFEEKYPDKEHVWDVDIEHNQENLLNVKKLERQALELLKTLG